MNTAISTISIMPSGKAEVAKFSKMLKDEILANEHNALDLLVRLKYIEKTITDVLKDDDIDRHFIREFDLYGKEKVVEVNGAKLNEQETGVKYLYEDCGDVQWNDLNKQIETLTEKKKARETLLRALPDGGLVDPESGNFITMPPKQSKSKIIVKFY